MTFLEIMTYSSILVWALALFKQYRTKYFSFFLINALTDPITRLFYTTVKLMPLSLYPTFFALRFISLTEKRKEYISYVFSIMILIISFLLGKNVFWLYILCIFMIVAILYVMFNKLINEINKNRTVNLFIVVFIIYQLISLIKNIAIILNLYKGATSFLLASMIQIFFGIFFIFVNVDTKSFNIKAGERKG